VHHIDRECRLSRTAHASKDNQLPERKVKADVTEIAFLGSHDLYLFSVG
jgi:hypothetical protein